MNRSAILSAVLASAAAVATGMSASASTPGDEWSQFDDTELVQIAKGCAIDVSFVKDNGHSIVFDSGSDGDFLSAACVLDSFPEWLSDVIASTTSLWGLVRNEVDGYVVLNSYHPDNGMFLVIHEA